MFRENYEPEIRHLKQFLRPGMVVIDVGASYGIYTVFSASLVGITGKVVALEPAREAFAVLKRNIELNRLGNAEAFQFAAAERRGSVRLCHHPDPSRNSLWAGGKTEEFEEVISTTLDELIEEQQIDHVDFVKIDAEGAEELILRGSARMLRKSHPIILFEINPEAATRLSLSRIGAWELLRSFGYSFFAVQPGDGLVSLTAPPCGGNVLAFSHGRS